MKKKHHQTKTSSKSHLNADASEESLGDVGGDGGAGLLAHHLSGVGVVLPLEDVVDAHVHEWGDVDVAEGRAESRVVVEEEGGAGGVSHGGLNGRMYDCLID